MLEVIRAGLGATGDSRDLIGQRLLIAEKGGDHSRERVWCLRR